jgi:HEAT repeat protein
MATNPPARVTAGRGITAIGVLIVVFLTPACSAEKRDWAAAEKGASESSYAGYLEQHPQGANAVAARLKVEELVFQQALASKDPDALQKFLARYPAGSFAEEARRRQDDRAWERGAAFFGAYEAYLAARPQGRHADEARAKLRTLLDARPPDVRDLRTVRFVLRQSFDEEVRGVTIEFESVLDAFFAYVGIKKAGADASADAVLTVTCEASPLGANYSQFGIPGTGSFYYSGARVSGRIVLDIRGKRTLREDFDGEEPVPGLISLSRRKDPSGAPFDEAMRKGFPKVAARLLARTFSYLPLVDALSSSDADVGPAAVDTFAAGGPPARELLLQAVAGQDAGIRIGAARALRGHKDPRVVEALVNGLAREGDDERKFRDSSAESLSAIGSLALPALGAAIKDGRPVVRQAAAKALGGIRTAPSLALLVTLLDDGSSPVRDGAIEAIGEHRTRAAVLTLIGRLSGGQAGTKEAILSAIGKSTATDTGDDSDERPPSLDWDADLAGRLVKMATLFVGDPGLRGKLTTIVGEIGEPAAGAVAQTLHAEVPAVRAWAAELVGKINDTSAIRPLAEIAGDPDQNVRLATAQALGEFLDARTIEPLSRLLSDGSAQVRTQALLSLKHELEAEGGRAGVARYLSSADTIKSLVDALRGTDAGQVDAREAAADVLGASGPSAVDALIEFSKGPSVRADDALTAHLYHALGESRNLRALDVLVAGTKDASAERRKAAVLGLVALHSLKAVDALMAATPLERGDVASEIDTVMRELTKFEPDEDTFNWKAWWTRNRARYIRDEQCPGQVEGRPGRL